MDIQLSEHFTLREMTASGTAIDNGIENRPDEEQTAHLRALCRQVLEPLRRRFGKIRVTSGYRSEALNALVGGVPRSQHLSGEAADIHVSNREVGLKMYEYIRRHLPFDQLLFESVHRNGVCWLHVSYREGAEANRREARELAL
jgi:zinc D-Ala-D-Ala carboxypeptidase